MTVIGLAVRPPPDTGVAAAHPDGGAVRQRDEAHPPDENATEARAPVAIEAGQGRDATAPSPQVITEVAEIGVTPSPQKGVRKRVTRRVEEETSDPISFPTSATPHPFFLFFYTVCKLPILFGVLLHFGSIWINLQRVALYLRLVCHVNPHPTV